jgi:hypothetical protein
MASVALTALAVVIACTRRRTRSASTTSGDRTPHRPRTSR